MIDGGFFLKRFASVYPGVDRYDAEEVSKRIGWLIGNHLEHLNKVQGCTNHWALLYRSF